MELRRAKDGVKKNQKVGLYKLLFLYADRRDVVLMIIGSIGAIANGASQPISTLAFSQLVNSLGNPSRTQLLHQVSKVALKILFVAIGGGIAGFLQVCCWMVAGERQSSRIRALYLKSLLRQEIAFFDTKTTTGEVMSTISGDNILIHEAMGEKVGKFIEFASTFISGFIIAFARGWFLSIVLLSWVPAIAIIGGFLALLTSKISASGQVAYAEAGNVVDQALGAIRTVASFSGETEAIEKYNNKLQIAYEATVRQGLATGVGLGLMLFTAFASYGFAFWYGSRLIIDQGYNGGDVVNVILAIMVAGSSMAQMSPCLNSFSAAQAAAYEMFEAISRQSLIDPCDTSGIVLENLEGEIEFQDIYFRYPSRPNVQIFSGLSLHVQKGKTLALVGQSGSGKSTVISLLERFYDPDAGRVMIDGIDLNKYQLRWIRGKMGLVSQEPVLFSTTVKENILYGKPDATDEEIKSAVELANCAEFIDKLCNGLDTLVGENGTQLSGGQKQRIAIARAILKNPRILLLDEATSALDAASERNVQLALEKVMPDRTTIVVAHRLSTIKNAHLIAVLRAGRLVEHGTHKDLIQNHDGAYHQLLCMQEGVGQTGKNSGNNAAKIDPSIKTGDSVMSSGRTLSGRFSSSRKSLSNQLSSVFIFRDETTAKENVVERSQTDVKNNRNLSIKRLARINKPELPALIIGSIAAGVHGVAFPVFGLLIATAFGIFFETPKELEADSRFWALMFVVVGAVVVIAAPVQNYMFGVAGGKLVQRIRSSLFENVVHQEISWFDNPANSSGAVGSRLSSDASTLRNLVGDTLALAMQNIATTVAGLLIAFMTNWKLALTIVVVVPLMLIEGYFRMKLSKDGTNKVIFEEASQVANDAVRGIRTIASLSAEHKVMEMYQSKSKAPTQQGLWHGIVGGAGLGFANFVLFSIYAFSFYVGAVLTNQGQANFSEVFKVFFAFQISSIGIAQSSSLLTDFNKFKESAASIFEILDRKSLIDSSSRDGLMLDTLKGDIKFQHVSFKYATRPDTQIFQDLSLSISSGKTTALVGQSGSGKSTVINLLQRFYDPDSGNIYLDEIEIRQFNLSWLRRQMGLVSQEPILFNETIRDNITYGSQGDVMEEEIIVAAKAAHAHNFISSLPDGYDTYVGERGIHLSGGQKQRIAIARVILKDPKILLLDEATSALDAESERLVMDALDGVRINRTTVIVAHRLSTVRDADTIAVVKDGVVAEKGTHEVLMGIGGSIYANLVMLNTSST
ncbi:ABC transporter B family member 9-like [Sesamum indicum]|uniref:ABC transporter B family member 9-like n=1 Tax=Sesamum indicum TaxID=4182 RepID=A0A6I9UEU9_SESIN|nr:ABC transporter B family member 9-like [Sesamum indicum]XP_011096471.1 ABC transporter B family member 9-like [Sesamum indicum]XP_020554017.1 ABC transporter B family member 9-like [Sesamum indicum]XP_020554018.1 ABC transporter B family member 9-like [Sesamum indicum]